MQSVFKTIQERKIDRVAAAYAVAAWILVQAASIVLPTFGAPLWMLKTLIVAAMAGFPVALWITWHVAAPAMPEGVVLRRTDLALLAVLVLVILLVGAQFAFEIGAWPGKRHLVPPPAAQSLSSPPSVAVLPFLNLSGDPAKDFFSDGIADELLNHLANARNLRVAARTSSFAFKGKSEDIRRIARALNVNAVVEGSVREDGRHIRIAAQLVNGGDGYPIWSKTYDRDLSNVLQLQDEIADSITAALARALGGAAVPKSAATRHGEIDPQSYRGYLKAQSLAALKTDTGDARAIALLIDVSRREPAFAPAFAALGRTYLHMADFHQQRQDLLNAAGAALNRALKLDPRNLEALSANLRLALLRWNWQEAGKDARALLAINPHNVFTLRGLYFYYAVLGFPERETAALREATQLDPLSFVDLNNLAVAYNSRGQYIEAASAAEDALARKADRPLTLYTLCWAYAGMHRMDKAHGLEQRLSRLGQQSAADGCELRRKSMQGDLRRADALANAIASRFPSFVFDEAGIGELYVLAGDYRSALSWLERAYAKRNSSLFSLAYDSTTPAAFLATSGWKELMARPDARAWQAARDRLARDLAQR